MTLPTHYFPHTLFSRRLFLGFFVTCLIISGTNVFAISPPSLDTPSSDSKKSDDPHLQLHSGIVGLALHLTARRVGDPAQLIIRAVHPSGPAARAGIMHGEEIISVNGQNLTGKTYQETVSMIRGEIGSTVKLGLRGPQGEREIPIVRVSENLLMEHTPQTM